MNSNMLQRNLNRFHYKQNRFSSLEEFHSKRAEAGISTIVYGDSVLDILMVDRQSTNTTVIFHAAKSKAWTSYPVFSGLGMMEGIDSNIIAISDPSLDLGLELAWFAGNRSQLLQSQLPGVIRHMLKSLRSSERTVFFGASGGGFAALFYSYLFPGSLALVANPQTDIGNYTKGPVDDYLQRAWCSDSIKDVKIVSDLTGLYADGFPNSVAYLQNIGDGHHRDKHLAPWIRGHKRPSRNLFLLMGDWGRGHIAPPVELFRSVLQGVFDPKNTWESALLEKSFTQAPSKTFAAEVFRAWSNDQ
ncbi:hypothetical protein [Glutamicibacter sp. NPDC087673]|uniref:hypothetical protein n=1 Tax=Glutamicibacter sp. NPDC087673 TaxID=3363997 RepID=UPI003809FD69